MSFNRSNSGPPSFSSSPSNGFSNSNGSRHNNNQSSRGGRGGGGRGRGAILGQKVWNSIRNAAGRPPLTATTTTTDRGDVVVGTQAQAIERMKTNSIKFKYPIEGFVCPIENSLLYSMICEPKIYPESVVLEQIQNEDFNSYLEIARNTSNSNIDDRRVSYAQLSALLLQSAENFPDVTPLQQQQQDPYGASSRSSSANRTSTRDYYDDDSDAEEDRRRRQQHQQPDSQQQQQKEQQRIPQALCKAVLSCVTRYADKHNLDRATEVKELLEPVESIMINKSTNSLLPIYIAYSVGLFIPGGVGVGLTLVSLSAMIAASDKADQNAQTVSKMNSQRRRVADMETAGLLDEIEKTDDYDDDDDDNGF